MSPDGSNMNTLEDRPMWYKVCKHPTKKLKRPVNAEIYDETYE
jgi:hypothetical protein